MYLYLYGAPKRYYLYKVLKPNIDNINTNKNIVFKSNVHTNINIDIFTIIIYLYSEIDNFR